MLSVFYYLTILFLPNNLGKHFIYKFSYVDGLLVDYMVPTLYIQDIFVVLLVFIALFKKRKSISNELYTKIKSSWLLRMLLIFVVCTYLATISSINPYVSVYYLARTSLYVLFSIVAGSLLNLKSKQKPTLLLLLYMLLFLEFLALGQWFLQRSVFNNYFFFGEQPYNFSTYGLAKESFFGKTVIPPYGLFRHPNILAGFLSILLIWIIFFIKELPKKTASLVIVLGMVVVVLTQSITALFSISVGIFFVVVNKFFKRKFINYLIALTLMFFIVFSLSLERVSYFFPNQPSIYRRVDLLNTVISELPNYLFFGTGPGTSTDLSAKKFKYLDDVKYPQPVHNVFLLTFIETGLFTFITYLGIFLYLIFVDVGRKKSIYSITFLQFFILGLFDHYILTIHQTNFLFWLTLSFYFAYNYSS